MSEVDIDRMPRMKDYLKPEDLNTTACVNLAATVLYDASVELTDAARAYADSPTQLNRDRLENAKRLYRSDRFKVLSCGVTDGETAMRQIISAALTGRRAKYRKGVMD